MRSAIFLLAALGVFGSPVDAQNHVLVTRPPARLALKFHLFQNDPQDADRLSLNGVSYEERRLFHNPGDPDSLFTLGSPTKTGELHLRAAFEVNDVVLRAITPDPLVDAADTRPRAAGDYRALDASGRPYQLRLGARLVW